jgi:hypothetical protein
MIRFAPQQRFLGMVLLLFGLGAFSFSGMRAYSRHLRNSPSGGTAGGLTTSIDLCRRGTPPDVAVSCIAEQRRIDDAARAKELRWGLFGVVSVLIGGVLLWRRLTDDLTEHPGGRVDRGGRT